MTAGTARPATVPVNPRSRPAGRLPVKTRRGGTSHRSL
jgi:hypothetical protein